MKPPMNEKVTLKTPILDPEGNPEYDSYGRPKLRTEESKARVQYVMKVLRDTEGVTRQNVLEIDLPPDKLVSYGSEITYIDSMGREATSQVVGMEEVKNLSGSRVYYRTVTLNG